MLWILLLASVLTATSARRSNGLALGSAGLRRHWSDAQRLRRGDPVDRYLEYRGIDLARLGRAPSALRYHHALWNSQSKRYWPAMVAAITSPNGDLAAIHCTWLAAAATAVTKAPIADHHGPFGGAKRTLGHYRGGGIRLWRGASGEAWGAMPKGETVMIGEGIEDTLSGVLNHPGVARPMCGVVVFDAGPRIAARSGDHRHSRAKRSP
jgi:hypothetical protein